jgi:hypothetical protein
MQDSEFQQAADMLNKEGEACSLEPEIIFNDVADCMEYANKTASSRPINEVPTVIWQTFLTQYSTRCFKRFQEICCDPQNNRLSQHPEKMWLEMWAEKFEPLWLAGCNLAKVQTINKLKGLYFSQHPEQLAKGDKVISDLLNRVKVELSENIQAIREIQKQAFIKTLKLQADYDKASPIGKLKMMLFKK